MAGAISLLAGGTAGFNRSIVAWVLFAIVTPGLALVSSWTTGGHDIPEWLSYTLSFGATSAVTCFLLSLLKGKLVIVHYQSRVTSDALKFGIKDILLWSTIAAIFISIMKWVGAIESIGQGLLYIGLSASAVSFLGVLSIWALLGNRLTPDKLLTLPFTIGGSALILSRLITDDFWPVGLMTQGVVLAGLVALRFSGYRFVKAETQ